MRIEERNVKNCVGSNRCLIDQLNITFFGTQRSIEVAISNIRKPQ